MGSVRRLRNSEDLRPCQCGRREEEGKSVCQLETRLEVSQ